MAFHFNTARILAIDFGKKRCGIAVTDELQIIASGLTTVNTPDIIPFLKKYFSQEKVEKVIIGDPKQKDGNPSEGAVYVNAFVVEFEKTFPLIPIERVDERYTSKMAFQSMIESGLSKKKRQNKALIDEIAATLILQEYLNRKKWV